MDFPIFQTHVADIQPVVIVTRGQGEVSEASSPMPPRQNDSKHFVVFWCIFHIFQHCSSIYPIQLFWAQKWKMEANFFQCCCFLNIPRRNLVYGTWYCMKKSLHYLSPTELSREERPPGAEPKQEIIALEAASVGSLNIFFWVIAILKWVDVATFRARKSSIVGQRETLWNILQTGFWMILGCRRLILPTGKWS